MAKGVAALRRVNTIRMFGHDVKVAWSARRPKWVPADARCGCFDQNEPKRIWINTDMSMATQRSTLVHEVLHLIREASETELAGENAEEAVVDQLEIVLDELFKRNPGLLIMYLQGRKNAET